MDNRTINPRASSGGLLVSLLIGGGAGLLGMLLLALLLPLAALRFDDPNKYVVPLVCICAFAGGGIGAFVSTYRERDRYIAVGLLTGLCMVAPMLLISLILPGGINLLNCVAVAASALSASLLSALVSSKRAGNGKRNMKKIMKRR
ncbi:MAG: DUF3792 family protein [Ruminococcaceae bacterium]|nr:DUF3792 family protein [Oscillospiraceae bacterium]